MTALIKGMDTYTQKQLGENLHTEYGISNDLDEKIVQFFYQLIRTSEHSSLMKQHESILTEIKSNIKLHKDRLSMMYKLIAQTRDIILGKGEQQLSFMQIYNFYTVGFENLAKNSLWHFVFRDEGEHPYGSWKDIKYFCNYIKEKEGGEHDLIEYAVSLALNQTRVDYEAHCRNEDNISSISQNSYTKEKLSLVGKWIPREKSKKFGWIFKRMALVAYPKYLETAVTPEKRRKAILKGRIHLNKILTILNRELETTQVKQCGEAWESINFNKVTSATLRKQTLAFTYKNKKGVLRGSKKDRLDCAENYKNHVEHVKNGDKGYKIHGRRLNVYELVKDAMESKELGDKNKEKIDTINLQWEDNRKNNKGLGNIIPCSDTSYSMTIDENIPLYNSIGLGIRVSEITHPAFRNRMLTFASKPVWHNLSTCKTFKEKVDKVREFSTGLNTDFYAALKMILDVLIEQNVAPEDASDMILAIFSDMQIDTAIYKNPAINTSRVAAHVNYMDTMFDNIKNLYAEAGLKSKFKRPYTPPHILFWNLRNTDGFPNISTQRNTSMISGYSSSLLNVFCEKGVDALKEFTPRKMLKDMLDNERYSVMERDIYDYLKDQAIEIIN